jgi:hypothetical protein
MYDYYGGAGYDNVNFRWSAKRHDNATIVRVGLDQPQVGKTELPATYILFNP